MVGQLTSAEAVTLARTFRQPAPCTVEVVVSHTRRRLEIGTLREENGQKMPNLSFQNNGLGFGVSGEGRLPDRVKLPSVAEQSVEKDHLGRTISS
jgi:hypothetical protein